jgi:hypothetical protein
MLIGMFVFQKILINSVIFDLFSDEVDTFPNPTEIQKKNVLCLAAYIFHLTVKEYQEICPVIPLSQEKVTMVEPLSPFDEEYFYWPGYAEADIGREPGNFSDGEQDVLVGAPNKDDLAIIYHNTNMYDEAADSLEGAVRNLLLWAKDYDRKYKLADVLEKVNRWKTLARSMEKRFPTYALKLEFNINRVIEAHGLKMEKFSVV